MQRTLITRLFAASFCLILLGCQNSYLSPEIKPQLAPLEQKQSAAQLRDWLKDFEDPELITLVNTALHSSFDIREAAARVMIARAQATISGAPRLPSIDLKGSGQRQKSTSAHFSENYSANLEMSWEVDLWGKLGNSARAGQLQYLAEQATYEGARLSLAGKVGKAWFDLQAQRDLQSLLQQRVKNLSDNMEIIESGYRQGINSALDLYLARSDLASETSQLHEQNNTTVQALRTLEILLGQKPHGKMTALTAPLRSSHTLKTIPSDIPLEIVYQRPDLNSAYLNLLAADEATAAAHKARYPGLRITASGGDSSDQFKQLFDQSSLAWNLLSNLTQPLFSGGKLKAQQDQKMHELRQKEQQFMRTLFTAWQELNNSLDTERNLRLQLNQLTISKDNAEAASDLAFEKYQQGLQTYTTVLESQRRSFSAQSNVINARKNLLQNRINFYLATGTRF